MERIVFSVASRSSAQSCLMAITRNTGNIVHTPTPHLRTYCMHAIRFLASEKIIALIVLLNVPALILRTYCMLYVQALKNYAQHFVASYPSYLYCTRRMG